MLYNECGSGKTIRVSVRDMLNVKRVNCMWLYPQYVVCPIIKTTTERHIYY